MKDVDVKKIVREGYAEGIILNIVLITISDINIAR